VHLRLLTAGVVILEGLDLSLVEPGDYELICLPLRLTGIEGAPARAMLRPL
jgi:arylformamidase